MTLEKGLFKNTTLEKGLFKNSKSQVSQFLRKQPSDAGGPGAPTRSPLPVLTVLQARRWRRGEWFKMKYRIIGCSLPWRCRGVELYYCSIGVFFVATMCFS